MVKESKAGQMARDSMVISHKERKMALARTSGRMAPTTQVTGRITKCVDKERTSGLTGENTSANG